MREATETLVSQVQLNKKDLATEDSQNKKLKEGRYTGDLHLLS